MSRSWNFVLFFSIPMCFLIGCERFQEKEINESRLVRTLVVRPSQNDIFPPLTGQVIAHTYINVSFRTSGKIIRRLASVGDSVSKRELLAELDDTIFKNDLRSAEADVADAQAVLVQAEKHAARVKILLTQRAVSQEDAESATRQLKAAQAQYAAARAQKHSAAEQLDYAHLFAEDDGIIVERYAENGEVVNTGQPIFKIALHEGRDAVFDMPDSMLENLSPGREMLVCLDRRREICSSAHIYEIAPEADLLTRTYRTKARIQGPEHMALGATLIGRLNGKDTAIKIPSSALFSKSGSPAVWLVDPKTSQVSLREIEIERYTTDDVIVKGLVNNEIIVTAGVHLLHQGQKVRVANYETH